MQKSQLQPAQYYSHPAVTRYFDHIQTRPSVRKSAEALAPAFSLVTIDLEGAPKAERKAEPPKEKKKKAAATPTESGASTPASKQRKAQPATETAKATESGASAGKAQKKEKKEKKPAEESKKGNRAPAGDAGEPVPSMIDLRVGHIVQSEHEYGFTSNETDWSGK